MTYRDAYFDLGLVSQCLFRIVKSFWSSANTTAFNQFVSGSLPADWTASDITDYTDDYTTISQSSHLNPTTTEVDLNSTAKSCLLYTSPSPRD